ncbi:hypothetical protein Q5P01_021517 [Channa striata]|uniref:Uncharacterized protein n=1 Tax=Channa striata TaxID=64152 RepID=A0AA88LUC5_CHASR|nr:hypothetical protein Q5P01_021517 [Channa striata]
MSSEDKDQKGDEVTLHAPDSSEESEEPPLVEVAGWALLAITATVCSQLEEEVWESAELQEKKR